MPRKKSKQRLREEFDNYVEHPRYGRHPQVTGLNPENDFAGNVFLHWHSPPAARVPNTAIPADLARQTPATVPVTHYFDVTRSCRDCGRPFIFFAREQKYWYEELGFPLDSDGVRCVPCRKSQQGIALKRERYEELFHLAERRVDENLEMADCCLSLIEAAVFGRKQLPRIRELLKASAPRLTAANKAAYDDLQARLTALEASDSKTAG